jgi:histidyl-tRNA synthetase
MIVEAEIISASSEALHKLGFNDFLVRLNHRKVLTGILDAAGIAPHKHGTELIALDKLDKIGSEGVLREFAEREVLSNDAGRELLALFEANTDNEQTLRRLQEFIGENSVGSEGLRDLREILSYVPSSVVRIDPSLARGLSYYTGAIMEMQVADLAGSLGGGGRYDNLIGMFLGQDIPACGFSLGLERIILVMGERNMFPVNLLRSPVDVMIAVWRDGAGDALSLASELRAAGIRVDVYPDVNRKLGTQIEYASKRNFPFIAFIGEDERAKGQVVLRNLSTKEQETIDRQEVVKRLTHVE